MKKVHDDIFIENSTFSRAGIKYRIYTEHLLPIICASCGLSDSWNNKPLQLQLEHKNGIRNDHRLSNLELLCPNCHSQTSTFCGRKDKKEEPRKTSFFTQKRLEKQMKWEKIKLDPIIAVGTWGWKKRLADYLNIAPQKVKKWLMAVQYTEDIDS